MDHINHCALYKHILKQTKHIVVSLVFGCQTDSNFKKMAYIVHTRKKNEFHAIVIYEKD